MLHPSIRRTFQVALLVLLAALPCFAQSYTYPAHDTHLGLSATTCTNTSTAFQVVTISNAAFLCSPEGHKFYCRGPIVFDPQQQNGADETGTTYYQFTTTKYGTNSVSTWAGDEMNVAFQWGWDCQGFYSVVFPGYTSTMWPKIAGYQIANYAVINKNGYASCAVKDWFYTLGVAGNTHFWNGFTSSSSPRTDTSDPCWSSYLSGFLNSDSGMSIWRTGTATQKGFLLGISDFDSDGSHCSGAGPDFAAAFGNNDFRCGYAALFVAPIDFADSHQAEIYQDPVIYLKKRLYDQMTSAYASIGALNTAWGGSPTYTTFATSGSCFGPLYNSVSSWYCTPGAAVTLVGTGTGPYTGTLGGTVSKFSVGISLSGASTTVVGGDTGTGNLYGPTISAGTINYSTGAISVTFTGTPATAPEASYCQNCWQLGTGLMDEDGRSTHSAWVGDGSSCITIYLFTSPNCAGHTGIANTTEQADLGSVTQRTSSDYYSTGESDVQTWAAANGYAGHVNYFGITATGGWGAPPDQYWLAGMKGHADGMMIGMAGQNFTAYTQAELNFVGTYAGDMPLIQTSYRTDNADSEFAWPNTACTHSGTTVSCTMATPFVSRFRIDSICNNTDYNVNYVTIGYSAPTLTYTATSTPTEANATCNIVLVDTGATTKTGGGFPTAAAMGTDITTYDGVQYNMTYSDGFHPYVGDLWWEYHSDFSSADAWGPVSQRDNPKNSTDYVNPVVSPCSLDASHNCGGENSVHKPPNGDLIPSLVTMDTNWDNYLLGATTTPVVPAPISVIAKIWKAITGGLSVAGI